MFGIFGAWVGWGILSHHYDKRAKEFDLALLEKMEAASIIYDREGKELGKIFIQNRHPVPLSEISPLMVKAVIAAEDNKFYSHNGVDYMGVLRAALANYRRGKIAQGASTVTQQLARNSFELRERTYQRKLVEMFLAHRIEKNLSKEKIMELYLNRVYFGSGFYGVEAAAKGYFGKSAKQLDASQCAMLAGLLKSPQALSPWNDIEAAKNTRNFVLRRMREMGFLTGKEATEFSELPLLVMRRTNPFKVSYAIDFIRQQAIAALGYDRAMNGGFRIQTTLDSEIQRTSEFAMKAMLSEIEKRPDYNHETFDAYRGRVKDLEEKIRMGNSSVKMPEPKYLQGAVLALENSTGGVLAIVGGRDFKHSEYNRALQARRPAGTAFTPFVFAAAYEKGIFPGELVEDACIDNRFVMVGGDSGILGEWGVERADNTYEGEIPARAALAQGKNAATVRLGFQAGLDSVKTVAKAAGITSPIRDYASSYLGSSEQTLDELTLAYTIFPNRGMRAKQPYIIHRILDLSGTQIYQASTELVKAISPAAAFQVSMGLEEALRSGTGSAAYQGAGLKEMPAAGKTGTAYNFTDTYFFGYNSSVTCGVWVGFDRPTRIFYGAFGKDLALPIWARIMNTAGDRFPAVKFLVPDTVEAVEICRTSGLLATPGCEVAKTASGGQGSQTYTEFATAAQKPAIRCDVHGGGIRSYAKAYNEGEWPRAVSAVDLNTIRPVAVVAPTLLGLNDVYQSVQPGGRGDDTNIPVARAIAVNGDAAEPSDPSSAPAAVPVAAAVPADALPAAGAEPEVRKAEAVNPQEFPMDQPAISAPTPEPINF